MLYLLGIQSTTGGVNYINGNIIIPFLLIAIIFILIIGWRKRFTITKTLVISLFAIYLALVIELAFFPIPVGGTASTAAMNLIPFTNIFSNSTDLIIQNLIGSILIMIPMGFFIPLISRKDVPIYITTFYVALISVFIKIIQFIGSFMIMNTLWKVVNLDDILMNILGGLIGAVIYSIFSKIIGKEKLNIC